MQQSTDFSGYPLSQALTRRVLNYLHGFRLFLGLLLGAAYLGGALVQGRSFANPLMPVILLSLYIALAGGFLVLTHWKRINHYHLAFVSLLSDVVLVSLLLMTFGGLNSGLGVLLLFVSTSAAILLPLREALFIASLATIAIVGEAGVGGYLNPEGKEHLVRSGLYGLTLFIITLLAHALSFWARDFRLIAERQALTLSRLEQINELIIKRMRSGVLAVDQSGRIRMMNESAWFLLGSPPVTDDPLEDVAPDLNAALQAWAADPRLDPEPITLDVSQARVVPRFVSLPAGREITALIFLEDSDVVSQRALELSTASLARLSTGIAHEIRNPLAAISHASQLLAENQSLEPADARLVDIIGKQSQRMNGIVLNILQLARREKSRPEAMNLETWLQELKSEFSDEYPDVPVDLIAELGGTEPYVLFDPDQLHQIMWKLLDNAAQHAGKADEKPRVGIQLSTDRPNEGFCTLSVQDNGLGIQEDQAAEIFEPFFTTRREGTGLGLYIARQLCEANHAELTVDSAPGHYARFQIRIPLTSGPGLPAAGASQG